MDRRLCNTFTAAVDGLVEGTESLDFQLSFIEPPMELIILDPIRTTVEIIDQDGGFRLVHPHVNLFSACKYHWMIHIIVMITCILSPHRLHYMKIRHTVTEIEPRTVA